MLIKKDISLRSYCTFGVEAVASYLVEYSCKEELQELFATTSISKERWRVLGGGSNTLFKYNYNGWILHPISYGLRIISEDETTVLVEADSGMDWDKFVVQCIERGWHGLENLSGIPGTVGASPVQNIGAYGVEAKDSIESVEVYNVQTNNTERFLNSDCNFGYRWSIFKQTGFNQHIVMSVRYRLKKEFVAELSYANLHQQAATDNPTAEQVREIVIAVRGAKLPNPSEIGSGGSFFKNPVVESSKADDLKIQYPDMPSYNVSGGVKIPAGWLIDKAGWKGYRKGDAGVYPLQALVLVNYGSASGGDIVSLANDIVADVEQKFGITISPEIIIL